MSSGWPDELDAAGIHADSIDLDVVSALWFAGIEPWLSLSLHANSRVGALRAGFAAGVATERGTLLLPPPHPQAEAFDGEADGYAPLALFEEMAI